MASRLIPLKFSTQVLRPTILPAKIEISDNSPRTPFSAVSPAHHHLLEIPRAPIHKTLETIFEEESQEENLELSTSSASLSGYSSSCNCDASSRRLLRFIALLMMQKHSQSSTQECKCC
ncbi:hypothetical protein DCAR_0831563 [Daucus carota subsp. sativus]|uniref:Uncharacterized protein n=1 Tax=Daucus carota subsp. sativus TaxID=79200 RepID=A0A175YNK1_DAUCS|nr:hypothetical protein DCAR_0831563 [Daucus carota subsp. sativus]